jgi:hypothetical protein
MRNFNNYVVYKAASAVVLLTDSSNISRILRAFEYSFKIKMNTIQSEHILEDAFRKTAEKGSHEIAKPSYYQGWAAGRGSQLLCQHPWPNDKFHLGNRSIVKEEASSITL